MRESAMCRGNKAKMVADNKACFLSNNRFVKRKNMRTVRLPKMMLVVLIISGEYPNVNTNMDPITSKKGGMSPIILSPFFRDSVGNTMLCIGSFRIFSVRSAWCPSSHELPKSTPSVEGLIDLIVNDISRRNANTIALLYLILII